MRIETYMLLALTSGLLLGIADVVTKYALQRGASAHLLLFVNGLMSVIVVSAPESQGDRKQVRTGRSRK